MLNDLQAQGYLGLSPSVLKAQANKKVLINMITVYSLILIKEQGERKILDYGQISIINALSFFILFSYV